MAAARVGRVGVRLGQRDQQPEARLAQRLPPRRGPVLVAILRQQLPRVQLERDAIRLDVVMRTRRRRSALERVDVDADPLADERHHVVAQHEAIARAVVGRDRPPRRVQHLVQAVAGRLAAGPQQLRHLLAVHAPLRCERQQLDQALCPAQPPRILRNPPSADAHGERAEQLDAERRRLACLHGATSVRILEHRHKRRVRRERRSRRAPGG
jgi:hypothetical protein